MLIQLCPDSWSILSCVCRYSPVNGSSLPHVSPLVHFVPVNSRLCLSFWFISLPPSVCPLYHSSWFILFRVCPFMRQFLVHFVLCMPQFLVDFVPCMPQFLVHLCRVCPRSWFILCRVCLSSWFILYRVCSSSLFILPRTSPLCHSLWFIFGPVYARYAPFLGSFSPVCRT